MPPALEGVCLKAMAHRPHDRYASPGELGEELERWLADEPVAAWPEPWTVRTGRWMRHHKAAVSGAAAALVVSLAALTAGLFWYQDEQNRRATESVLREQDAERKKAVAEADVRRALDQAEAARQELYRTLTRPGGVFELLNRPENWQAKINLAEAPLERARALAKSGADLEPKLGEQADALQTELRRDDEDRRLAVHLEKIRMNKAAVVGGKFDHASADRDYRNAFAGIGVSILEGETEAPAARIRTSHIKEQLVAALDDWAFLAFRLGKEGLAEKILTAARHAAPDPAWGDRLRQIKLWSDRKTLTGLVKDAHPASMSPQMLELVGVLLGEENPMGENWLRQAQAQYPADFWLNFDLANALLKRRPLEAAGFFRVAIAARPGSAAAYNNLGNALSNNKQLPEAVAAYHKAIELDPKLALAHDNLGSALRSQNKLPEAVASHRQALALDPYLAPAYSNLGVALSDQGKLPEASAAFHKAIELDPNDATVYAKLGNALGNQRKLGEAIAACRKALELDPKLALAYSVLGNAFYDMKNLAEATAAYQRATELDPKDAGAYFNLGLALREQKKLPEAVAAYRMAIELDPSDPQGYSNLGNVLYAQKKISEACAAYQRAIEVDGKYAPAYHNLGNALLELQKYPEAGAAFRKAIELDPNHALAHGGLGIALYRSGRFEEAALALGKAVELLPNDHSSRTSFLKELKKCQHMQALDMRLAVVLQDGKAAAAGELLELALMCQEFKGRYRTAVRLYENAFASDAGLAEGWTKQPRYHAARRCRPCRSRAGGGSRQAAPCGKGPLTPRRARLASLGT